MARCVCASTCVMESTGKTARVEQVDLKGVKKGIEDVTTSGFSFITKTHGESFGHMCKNTEGLFRYTVFV